MRQTPSYDWVQHKDGSFSGRCECGHEVDHVTTAGMLGSAFARHANVLEPSVPSGCPAVASAEFAAELVAS